MGLDIVDIIVQTEDDFSIKITDDEASKARTVGDLYRLILGKLELPYESPVEIEKLNPEIYPKRPPWTSPKVWLTLKYLIWKQLQVDERDIREDASFVDDLGVD